jgi:hypothetical protein
MADGRSGFIQNKTKAIEVELETEWRSQEADVIATQSRQGWATREGERRVHWHK